MISQALDVASRSTDFQQRIGCVITDKKGKVISTGFNKRKSHPLQAKHAQHINEDAIYLHAEIDALVRCRKKPHSVYVGRLTRDGSLALAKPCPICMGAIVEAGVKEVYYTTNEGNIEGFLVKGI
jgi:deoxycytidylate deaminase